MKTPEINTFFPAASDVERGTMVRIYVDLLMPWPSPDIVVTVSSGGPEVRVLRLSVTEVGENYAFFVSLFLFFLLFRVASTIREKFWLMFCSLTITQMFLNGSY